MSKRMYLGVYVRALLEAFYVYLTVHVPLKKVTWRALVECLGAGIDVLKCARVQKRTH